jgi:hypothetical protein
LDKDHYAATANATYNGGSMFQKVYVRANYSTGGEQLDTVYATSGEQVIAVPVHATAVSLDGGAAVSATWTMDAKPIPDAVVTGPISAALSMSLMVATDTKDDVIINGETGATVVRIHNADENGTKTNWPAEEIDENAGRYVDFSVTAPATMEVRVTKISMYIGAYSTGFMKCHINTGFGDGFTDVHTIYEAAQTALPNKEMRAIELTPTLTILAGETLHVRVLPWHEHSSGSGKYILLRDVTIEGQAFEPQQEGVEQVRQEPIAKSQKLIKDGRLLIIRDGKTYNALGVEMK